MQVQSNNAADSTAVISTIPAISVVGFCETDATAAVMRSAAADRRMSRASFHVETGGIAAAIAAFQNRVTPNVLIVECPVHPSEMLNTLAPLAEVCDPETRVVVVGHINDVLLYRDLIRNGVAEYLVAPLHPLQLMDALAGLYSDPSRQPSGRVTAFIGAKGGSGSSTIAHNVGWLFSNWAQLSTVVTDLDLSYGTSALNFNQDVTVGIADAVAQADRLDPGFLEKLFTHCDDHLSLLAGNASLDREMLLTPGAIDAVLTSLRQAAPNIIVDMPSAWTDWSRQTLIAADDVVITATPELAAARNVRNILELLRQSRQNDRPPILVLNQTGIAKRPELTAEDFRTVTGIEPSIIIPYDPVNFGTAATTGKMLCQLSPRCKPALQMAILFETLNKPRHEDAEVKKPKSSLLVQLKKMLTGKK